MTNSTTFNGWSNYETWNVALWINNDDGLYAIARGCGSYAEFVDEMRELGSTETPDRVAWNDSGIDRAELDEMLEEAR